MSNHTGNKVPSFDEVMTDKVTPARGVPSFEDIMGDEPVKKKEVSKKKWYDFGIPSVDGSQSSSSGKALEGAIGAATKVIQAVPKTEPFKFTPTDISEYNRKFEEATGHRKFSLSQPTKPTNILETQRYEKKKKEFEERKYLEYKNIEENEINPVLQSVSLGTVQPQQLKKLYENEYGKNIAKRIIKEQLPEESTMGLDEDVFGSEEKWNDIANKLQEKNRSQGIEAQNQHEFNLDADVYNTLNNFKYGNRVKRIQGKSDIEYTDEAIHDFDKIDTNNPSEISKVIDDLERSQYLFDKDGKIVEGGKDQLLKKLKEKLFYLKASEPIHPEILGVEDSLKIAVANVGSKGWKNSLGLNPDNIPQLEQTDLEYVKSALNYLRDEDPGRYKTILGVANVTKKMADTDYEYLVRIGKDLKNHQTFKEGGLVQDDDRDFSTYQSRKANYSGALSEEIKKMGYKNNWKINDKIIVEAANRLGIDPSSDEVMDIRRAETDGGKGIVKGGGVRAFMRGAASPVKGIIQSFEVAEDPFKAYLNSRKLDYGDQKVMDGKGVVSDVLPSERRLNSFGNIFNKALEGFGQFSTQVLLSRGIGKGLELPYNLASRYVPRAALTPAQKLNIAAFGGGGISTFAQTYGQSYLDFLNKTGNPNKAAFMAAIDAAGQSVIEVGILPDVKLAEQMKGAFKGAKDRLASGIIKVVDKGGGAEAAKPIFQNFVKETGKILGKEVLGEEVGQNAWNYFNELVFSPQTAKDRNLAKESGEVIKEAGVQMLIPALLGGFGNAKNKATETFTKDALNAAGINYDDYRQALGESLANGSITQQDHDKALNILTIHSESIKNAPKRDANGDPISVARQMEYAYQNTIGEINKSIVDSQSDKVQSEPNQKIVDEADKVKRKIFYGEEVKDLPKEEPEIDQNRELNTEGDVTPEGAIQNAIENGTLKGGNLFMGQTALSQEGGADMFLSSVADQALNKVAPDAIGKVDDAAAMEEARRNYGDELVDMAIKFYPKSEVLEGGDLMQEENISEKQPEQVSIQSNEQAIKVGDSVQWTSQGVDQFDSPRKITSISEDGKFVTVEGSNTGIPIEQVTAATDATTPSSTNKGSVKSFEERTDSEHATYIKDKFEQEFTSKGVPKEQVQAAVALMEARAKASGLGDAWYRQIDDIGNGKFESTDVLYQFLPKKVKKTARIAAAIGLVWNLNAKIPNKAFNHSSDKNTISILNEISKEDGFVSVSKDGVIQPSEKEVNQSAKQYIDSVWDKAGSPKIVISREGGKSYYNPSNNTITISVSLNKPGIVPIENESGTSIKGYAIAPEILIDEMAHAMQAASGDITLGRAAVDFIKSGFDWDKTYDKKGTIENEAHDKIGKQLSEGFRNAVKYEATRKEKEKITKFVKDYYAVNGEVPDQGKIDRAIEIWEVYGKPAILPDSTNKNERAYSTVYHGDGNVRIELGNITNFEDYIAEMAHAAQYMSGAELSMWQYKTKEDFDKYEYQRKGSVEYDAHELLEPLLAAYVITGKRGTDLILSAPVVGDKRFELEGAKQKYNIKYQGKKGAVETLANGRKVIHALDAPDFSTTVHELAHVFEDELSEADRKVVQDWAGTETWNTETSEAFARGFERYLRDGNAPTSELKTLFDKFKQWLTSIYKSLKGSPIAKKISPEVKQVFDRLLTEQNETTSHQPTKESKPITPEEESGVKEKFNTDSKSSKTSSSQQAEQGTGGKPPKEPPPVKEKDSESSKKQMKDKGILSHLHGAENIPEASRIGFEKEGLKYETKSQTEADSVAKSIVEFAGVEQAVEMAEAQKFDGDVNSLIFGHALNEIANRELLAKTPEEKLKYSKQFAEVSITYDKTARYGGRFNAAINQFYKKSPLGIVIKENAQRKEDFNEWSKPKDQSWKEFFDEMMKEPEFAEVVKKQVQEDLKKQRQEAREKRIEKVQKAFKNARDKFDSGGAMYATVIPPKVIQKAIDLMEKAYLAGESVAKVIQDGIDYISTELGNQPWDSEKFRKEWEAELKEEGRKKPLTDKEKKVKNLEKFKKRLKGLSEEQKNEVIRKSLDKLYENEALDYEDFRKIIAQATGRADLTPEEVAKMKDLVVKTNAVDDAAKKWREEKTKEAEVEYRKAQIEATKATRDLNDMFQDKPDIVRRLVSMMQLNTLGIVSLIANVTYNVWNQSFVRFPIGVINNLIDRGVSLFNSNYEREFATVEAQMEFWQSLGVGAKEAAQQIGTGLNRQDYLSKEIPSQFRPFKSARELWAWKKGKKNLSKAQVWDRILQASPQGISAEIVARLLNVGDKPQRFGAEGAQAAAFANTLGLKGIDRQLFIEFPREQAYEAYKAQGLSDEVAGQKADYVKEAIIQEGKRSTFQQDNLLHDAIARAAGVLGGKDSGTAGLAKTLLISPYIKIPTNAFWSLYNLLNPEVAMLQAMTHAGIAKKYKNKGDLTKAKLQNREARYWMGHAIWGIAARAVVISLVKAGVFVPSADDDESKKERDATSFFDKPGYINIGDLKISNRWFGVLGAMGNSIAKKWKDMTPEQREAQDEFWNIALGGMEFEALKEMENGVFANSSSLLQSLGTGDFSRYGINTLNLFANILQPATSAQFDRAQLDYVPSSKGDSFLDKLNQNFAQRSKLYRRIFDVEIRQKKDIWGQPIPKGGNELSRMFGISKGDPQLFGRPIYNDFLKTGDSGFLPPAVLPILNGQQLNNEQENRLIEYIGSERKKLAEPYVNDQAQIKGFNLKYSELDDEDKKFVLQYLYQQGREFGLEKFYQDYPEFRPKEESPNYQREAAQDIFKSIQSLEKYKK